MLRCLGAAWVGVVCLACGSSESRGDDAEPSGGAGASAVGGRAGSAALGGRAGEGQGGQAGRGENAGGAGGEDAPSGDAGDGSGGTGASAGSGGDGPTLAGAGGDAGGESGGAAGSGGEGACAGCESGVCLEDATCVECTSDAHCSGELGRCDVTANVCVECAPLDDDCPAGSYCSAELTCVSGCKDEGSCASGLCDEQHECRLCVGDWECTAGRVCASGACSDPCTEEGSACGDGGTCCAGRCVDTSRDIEHCGACSSADPLSSCEATEFCGKAACLPVGFANVCETQRAALLRGSLRPDDLAGDLVAQGLATCPAAPVFREVSQDDAVLVNTRTGQPVVGPGELVVVAGGPFVQRLAGYLEDNDVAPVSHEFVSNTHYELHRTSDGQVLARMSATDNTSTHDFALLELSRDPVSGTLVLVVSGFNANGTAAGAWYFANVMMPTIADFSASFYVFEWTDTGAPGADSADEFALLASGP